MPLSWERTWLQRYGGHSLGTEQLPLSNLPGGEFSLLDHLAYIVRTHLRRL